MKNKELIDKIELLLGHIDGINDERDSVPLLLEFRKLWPEIKKVLEKRYNTSWLGISSDYII